MVLCELDQLPAQRNCTESVPVPVNVIDVPELWLTFTAFAAVVSFAVQV